MRKIILLLATMVLALLLASGVALSQQVPPAEGFVPGEVLVKFEPGTPASAIAEAHRQNRGEVIETIPRIGVQVVSVSPGQELARAAAYERNPNVLYAEVNGLYQAVAATSDSRVNEQWGYNNTGQTGGTDDADIDAFEAWDANKGNATVAIAVLDTGIQASHEDLQGKVTKAANFTDSSTVDDIRGHGTHVAGSAAASTNNGMGVAGTCPDCSLYNGKVLGDSGSGAYSWIAQGITWSADNGAKVINMSLGGSSASSTLQDAVNYAWGKGVVVVAAAGNSGSSTPFYPAAYENAIAVGATDHKDAKASYSNYGSWVDVAAPGSDILSTTVDGGYATKNGTSMATPHVAGVAGLVWSTSLGTNSEVRKQIESSAADRTVLAGIGPDWSKARINACTAVGGTNCAPPPDTTAPTVSSVSPSDGKTGVLRSTNVTVTFSEAIDSATLSSSTFSLVKSGTTTSISATRTLSSDGKTVTLNPYGSSTTNLARCAWYKATVTTGVKDKAGNPLAANKVWSFKTRC